MRRKRRNHSPAFNLEKSVEFIPAKKIQHIFDKPLRIVPLFFIPKSDHQAVLKSFPANIFSSLHLKCDTSIA